MKTPVTAVDDWFGIEVPKVYIEYIANNPWAVKSNGRGGHLLSELGKVALYLIRDYPDVAHRFDAEGLVKSVRLGSMEWMNEKELSDAKCTYALIDGTPLCYLAEKLELTREDFLKFLRAVEKLTGLFNQTAFRCWDR